MQFSVLDAKPFSNFWFEIDPKDGTPTTKLDNNGNGYYISNDVFFIQPHSLGPGFASRNVTVAVATSPGSEPDSVVGHVFQMSPPSAAGPLLPAPPINVTTTFIRNTWANVSFPGFELWTATPDTAQGSYTLDVEVSANGTVYLLGDIPIALFSNQPGQ